MRKGYRISALFLALVLLILPFGGKSYATQNHWANDDIQYVKSKGIMVGDEKGEFHPNKEITRAEVMTALNNFFDYSEKAKINFLDVKPGAWYYEEVQKAVKAGYISGCGDGMMKPNANITRQEVAHMIAKACDLSRDESNLVEFKDEDTIANWAKESVKRIAENGIMIGDENGNFNPTQNITRAEVATVICNVDNGSIEEPEEPEGPQEPIEEPPIDEPEEPIENILDEWFVVQIGAYGNWDNALGQAEKLMDAGFENTFIIFNPSTCNYHVLAGKFKERASANIFMNEVRNKGFQAFVNDKLKFKAEDEIKVGESKPELPIYTNVARFVKLVNELPNPQYIDKMVVVDNQNIKNARQLYDNMTAEEKSCIDKKYVDKFVAVERKINSLKTPIISGTKVTLEQAQQWARNKGAHQRFIDIAPTYWKYGELTGIRPEILYCQAAKETGFGKYKGKVKPEMNNWAGIKVADSNGDRTEDHETFDTPDDGVRGHFNHMGIYCGVDPIGVPHPRWYKTSTVGWAGTVKHVEDLGGKWAPNPDYGISIVRDYLTELYNTKVK